MDSTFTKALVGLVFVSALVTYSAILFVSRRSLLRFIQLLGAACLLVVVLTHIAEAKRVFPAMRWGQPDSAGHYVDLTSAVLGLLLLVFGLPVRLWVERGGIGRSRSSAERNR